MPRRIVRTRTITTKASAIRNILEGESTFPFGAMIFSTIQH